MCPEVSFGLFRKSRVYSRRVEMKVQRLCFEGVEQSTLDFSVFQNENP